MSAVLINTQQSKSAGVVYKRFIIPVEISVVSLSSRTQVSESFLPDAVSPMLSQSWPDPGYTPPATVNLALGTGPALLVEFRIKDHSGLTAVTSRAQVSLKHSLKSQPENNNYT